MLPTNDPIAPRTVVLVRAKTAGTKFKFDSKLFLSKASLLVGDTIRVPWLNSLDPQAKFGSYCRKQKNDAEFVLWRVLKRAAF
jgi:hypothetical protein